MCLCEEVPVNDGHGAQFWVLNSRKCEPASRILLFLALVYELAAQRMPLVSTVPHIKRSKHRKEKQRQASVGYRGTTFPKM